MTPAAALIAAVHVERAAAERLFYAAVRLTAGLVDGVGLAGANADHWKAKDATDAAIAALRGET